MKEKIDNQVAFCAELMNRLVVEISDSMEYQIAGRTGIAMYTRTQEDIKRLRRELLTLEKMIDPWREE
jgi:hypothetical protein